MAEAKGEGSYHWLTIVVKVVTYWLARQPDPQFKVVLSREHQAFKWVDYEEACHLLAEFSDLQDLLGRFQQKLGNMNKSFEQGLKAHKIFRK